jgi:transcription factor TFIIIB component B''
VTQDTEAPSPPSPPRRTDEQVKSSEGSTPIPTPSRRPAASPVSKPAALPVQPPTVIQDERFVQSSQESGPVVTDDATQPETEGPTRKRRKVGPNSTAKYLTSAIEDSVLESPSAPDEDPAGGVTTSSTKRRTKPTRTINESVEAHTDEIVADAAEGGRAKKKRRQKRPRTPEDAETVEIAVSVVKMADLCKDLHTGKKSKREITLQGMNWADIARKKKERRARALAMRSNPQQRGKTAQEATAPSSEQATASAPQMRIVNGEIVLDSASLQINRHEGLNAESAQLEVIEENSLMETINSHTHMKKSDKVSWDETNTALFYKGLRMFGTDFEMIKRLFPHPAWTRRTIKLKFLNEERKDFQRIKDTLLGPKENVDVAEFSRITNTVYEDPIEVDRLLAVERKNIEQEHAQQKEAHDEILREAEALAAAAKDAAAAESSAKENEVEDSIIIEEPDTVKKGRKSRATKKRTQSKNSALGEFEVLGSVEEARPPIEDSAVEKITLQDAEPRTKNAQRKSSRAKGPRKPVAAKKTAPRGKKVTAV